MPTLTRQARQCLAQEIGLVNLPFGNARASSARSLGVLHIMAIGLKGSHKAASALVIAGLGAAMLPLPAYAQSQAQVNQRLERIEGQLRAVQRVVFPGGSERFFEPEVDTGAAPVPGGQQVGIPSGGALTDVLVRLEALEGQLSRLTAATEVNANALDQMERRLLALENTAAPQVPATPAPQATGVIPLPSVSGSTAPPAATAEGPSPQRVAAVQAIAKPATGDMGDDEYVYGFRLWEAGFYPEAQQQLGLFVERYPSHARISFGRNLLGRAFLDAGDPRRAATHFFENYQANKQAARAPDSLLFLAESMIALGDTGRACIALAEFGDTYPALATGRLQGQYDTNRRRIDCSS